MILRLCICCKYKNANKAFEMLVSSIALILKKDNSLIMYAYLAEISRYGVITYANSFTPL